ncbi:MAG: hypothetical protein R3C99_22895 [Pirellulaceae bacterium]
MNRPCLALSMMLAALAGTMLLVEKSEGSELGSGSVHPSRVDVCPLTADDYFGCELENYAAERDDSRGDLVAENWDYFDDCHCPYVGGRSYRPWHDEYASEDSEAVESTIDLSDDVQEVASDEVAETSDAVDSETADLSGIGHCLSGYDLEYDQAVYGAAASPADEVTETTVPAAPHVEADYEFTYDEYVAVYGVERGGHMFVARFEDESTTTEDAEILTSINEDEAYWEDDPEALWEEDLFENFPTQEVDQTAPATETTEEATESTEATDATETTEVDATFDDEVTSWDDYDADFYANEYEAYEYDCHYGRNPWLADTANDEAECTEETVEDTASEDAIAAESDVEQEWEVAEFPQADDSSAAWDYADESDYDYGYDYDADYGYDYDYGYGEDYGYESEDAAPTAEIEDTINLDAEVIEADARDVDAIEQQVDVSEAPATEEMQAALGEVVNSPLAQSARSLTDASIAETVANLQDVDWVALVKTAVSNVSRMKREAAREEMIEYYGLDQDEYAWQDSSEYYENFYSVDSATTDGTPWQRLTSGCGREMILEAAGALDDIGSILRTASERLTNLTELR